MKNLAYEMTKFDNRIEYKKALCFIERRKEQGLEIYWNWPSVMVYCYWQEV